MMILLGFATLGLVAVGGRLGLVLLREHLDDRRVERGRVLGLKHRALDLKERQIVAQENRQRSPAVPVSIPPDLYRRITRWGTSDAQNDERATLLDLYQEFRDSSDPWAEVRAHLPTEPDDRMPDDIFAGPVS